MRTVDILVPELSQHDATANHSLLIRDLLVADGIDVRIVVERPTARDERVTLLAEWNADADLTILQHAIGSEAANMVVTRGIPVVVNYHNVTPPEFVDSRPAARLVLVGSSASQRYHSSLITLADRLGLADRVMFAGSVSESQLTDWYSRADVFCCASEHEGFCVPIVEAMHHGVPVVAYAAAAVPETVSDAGIVLSDKSPATFALAIDTVLSTPGVARALRSAGKRRALDFQLEVAQGLMRHALGDLLGVSP